jgi:hypothetical protein
MLGRKELADLDLQKQALLLESDLNRVTLQAEVQSLRSATAWVNDVTSASRGLAPLLVVLAPLSGFLLARGSRRSDSWLRRLMALAKWVAPLYRLWKSFSARRSGPEAGTPTA